MIAAWYDGKKVPGRSNISVAADSNDNLWMHMGINSGITRPITGSDKATHMYQYRYDAKGDNVRMCDVSASDPGGQVSLRFSELPSPL